MKFRIEKKERIKLDQNEEKKEKIKEIRGRKYVISGIEIEFPFEAYLCQIEYMNKVILALRENKNALLESPTGTGKTLCLLCASLGYQRAILNGKEKAKNFENFVLNAKDNSCVNNLKKICTGNEAAKPKFSAPRILYASRTHSQLRQVIKELKNTSYVSNGAQYLDFEKNTIIAEGLKTSNNENRISTHSSIKSVLLGSRDHLCIHRVANSIKGVALNAACVKLVKNQKCIYYAGVRSVDTLRSMFSNPMDIEDLKACGRGEFAFHSKYKAFCPYYAVREHQADSNLVLMPYNYLFSSEFRSALKLELKNMIIILDEAHNIESSAEEAASVSLRQIDLGRGMKAIKDLMLDIVNLNEKQQTKNAQETSNKDLEIPDSQKLLAFSQSLANLDQWIYTQKFTEACGNMPEPHIIYTGCQIYEILQKAGIDVFMDDTYDNVVKLIEDSIQFMLETLPNNLAYSENEINKRSDALEKLKKFFRSVLSDTVKNNLDFFRGYMREDKLEKLKDNNESQDEKEKEGTRSNAAGKLGWNSKRKILISNASDKNKNKTVNEIISETHSGRYDYDDEEYARFSDENKPKLLLFWCFCAAASIHDIVKQDIWSLIVTSGTLSPIQTLASQLSASKFKFEVFLENEHVIKSNQIFSAILNSGPRNVVLDSRFQNRNSIDYLNDLGLAVIQICIEVPNGVLLFFPSYVSMFSIIKHWRQKKIYEQIEKYKKIFIEPSNTSDLQNTLKEFEELVRSFSLNSSAEGGIIMAVCRGKISEGIDFADEFCRCVIVAGLPYPMVKDPRLELKRKFIDENKTIFNFSSISWYNQQALRAVNQAIGRVIRHKNDFGAIILADRRFAESSKMNDLSHWLRNTVKVYSDFANAKSRLNNFFANIPKYLQSITLKTAHADSIDDDFMCESVSSCKNNQKETKNILCQSNFLQNLLTQSKLNGEAGSSVFTTLNNDDLNVNDRIKRSMAVATKGGKTDYTIKQPKKRSLIQNIFSASKANDEVVFLNKNDLSASTSSSIVLPKKRISSASFGSELQIQTASGLKILSGFCQSSAPPWKNNIYIDSNESDKANPQTKIFYPNETKDVGSNSLNSKEAVANDSRISECNNDNKTKILQGKQLAQDFLIQLKQTLPIDTYKEMREQLKLLRIVRQSKFIKDEYYKWTDQALNTLFENKNEISFEQIHARHGIMIRIIELYFLKQCQEMALNKLNKYFESNGWLTPAFLMDF